MIQKTGILGGTFDPVHMGHLALAEAAGRLCNLDEIILLPAAVPPHKQQQTITPFAHRLAMLEIAVKGRQALHVSSIEQLLPSPSYTIDTLSYLKRQTVLPLDFFFITGADTFLDIESWKEYKQLLGISNFIVFLRSGHNEEKLSEFLSRMGYGKKDGHWFHASLGKWVYTSGDPLPSVSSSELRRLMADNRPVGEMIPQGVLDYICREQLYSG